MYQRDVVPHGPPCEHAWCFSIDAHRKIWLVLRFIDGGVGSRVDNEIRSELIQTLGNRAQLSKIKGYFTNRNQCAKGLQAANQCPADLPRNTRNKNAHYTCSKIGNFPANACIDDCLAAAHRVQCPTARVTAAICDVILPRD